MTLLIKLIYVMLSHLAGHLISIDLKYFFLNQVKEGILKSDEVFAEKRIPRDKKNLLPHKLTLNSYKITISINK